MQLIFLFIIFLSLSTKITYQKIYRKFDANLYPGSSSDFYDSLLYSWVIIRNILYKFAFSKNYTLLIQGGTRGMCFFLYVLKDLVELYTIAS